jgi:BirA family biotin operon repressor/biotin-[acetyl-CoA-carboxylase] ligase
MSPLPDGFTLIELEEAASTNDEAARLASEGGPDGTVVWARRQTAGRGRRGRAWTPVEGNLYFSVLMRPGVPLAEAAALSFVAAVATGDAVAEFLPTPGRVEHKWPNDVLVGGSKIAGILLEASGGARTAADWVVVGCGVNVAGHPDVAGLKATDLSAESGGEIAAGAVLPVVLNALRRWRQRWETAGIAPVRDAWLARARGLGEDIIVRLPQEELRGRFDGLDDSGALLLRLSDGTCRSISAGDVFFDDQARGR